MIVWGVDCRHIPERGDVPSTKHPIRNVKRFLSYLEGATSGCSLPPHDGVRHHGIETEGTKDGFVVSFVPKSMFAPHQCIVGKYKDRYYVRVGSNFQMAPHGLLAGMFGRQPAPNISHRLRWGGETTPDYSRAVNSAPTSTPFAWLEVTIGNDGVTVAREVYANFSLCKPGPDCLTTSEYNLEFRFSKSLGGWHLISEDDYRLAPAGMVVPFKVNLYLMPPFDAALHYDLSFGCDGSPVKRVVTTVPAATIELAYEEYLATDRGKEAGQELAKAVLGA